MASPEKWGRAARCDRKGRLEGAAAPPGRNGMEQPGCRPGLPPTRAGLAGSAARSRVPGEAPRMTPPRERRRSAPGICPTPAAGEPRPADFPALHGSFCRQTHLTFAPRPFAPMRRQNARRHWSDEDWPIEDRRPSGARDGLSGHSAPIRSNSASDRTRLSLLAVVRFSISLSRHDLTAFEWRVTEPPPQPSGLPNERRKLTVD